MDYTDVLTGLIAIFAGGLGIFFGSWLYTRRTGVIMLFFLAWAICIDHARILWQQMVSDSSGYGTDAYVVTKAIMCIAVLYVSFLVVKGQFTRSIEQNIVCEQEFSKLHLEYLNK
jgi:hypothetical protein